MRAYEEKRADRIANLRDRADGLDASAQAYCNTVHSMSEVMAGTPILVGHHSEKRHRRDCDRMDAAMRKSIEATKAAEDLRRRADAAERNRAVSSDDPAAVEKLQTKLDGLRKLATTMREVNKVVRSHARKGGEWGGPCVAAIVAAGLVSERIAKEAVQKDELGRLGFPDYALTNTRAEIRRLEKRIESLTAKASAPTTPDETIGAVRISEGDNRVRMYFDGKPSEAIRDRLKSNGFRWSPTEGAWQRMASVQAWYLARTIAKSEITA